jgi:cytochrome c5
MTPNNVTLNIRGRKTIVQSHPEDMDFVFEVENAINSCLELENSIVVVTVGIRPWKAEEETEPTTDVLASVSPDEAKTFLPSTPAPPEDKPVDMSCAICHNMDYTEVPAAGRFWHQRCVENAVGGPNASPAVMAAAREFGLIGRN